MFSEFGACYDGERCAVEIANSTDAFDSELASWAYWMYKSFGDFTTTGGTAEGMFNEDGSVQELKKDAITRTYAHAIGGTPTKMFFSTENDAFFLEFDYDATVLAPTEIYADLKDRYEIGYQVHASLTETGEDITEGVWAQEGESNYLTWTVPDKDAAAALNGKSVTLHLTQNDWSDGIYLPDNGWLYRRSTMKRAGTNMCGFNVSIAKSIPGDFELHVLDTDGNRALRFKRGDEEQEVHCSKLVNGKITLVEMPKSFWGTTKLAWEEPIRNFMGVFTDINVSGKGPIG